MLTFVRIECRALRSLSTEKTHHYYYTLEEQTQLLLTTSITCVYGESPVPREKIIKETANSLLENIHYICASNQANYLQLSKPTVNDLMVLGKKGVVVYDSFLK